MKIGGSNIIGAIIGELNMFMIRIRTCKAADRNKRDSTMVA
jgi:hypothetical protein